MLSMFGCSNKPSQAETDLQTKVASLESELKQFRDDKAMTDKRLAAFDVLDFDQYTHQKWAEMSANHTDDVKVYYPDGSTSTGLAPEHVDKMKPQFVFAPDTSIKVHPIKFGTGEWTAVVGEMEGTFSQPIPLGNGQSIPPTGKRFKIPMVTISHWKGEKMDSEYLYWNNELFNQQIGLGK